MSQKVISLVSFVSLFFLLLAVPVWALVRIDPLNTITPDQEEVLRGGSSDIVTETVNDDDEQANQSNNLEDSLKDKK